MKVVLEVSTVSVMRTSFQNEGTLHLGFHVTVTSAIVHCLASCSGRSFGKHSYSLDSSMKTSLII